MDKEIVVRLHSSFEDMVRKHPDTVFWHNRAMKWETCGPPTTMALT